MLKIVRMLFCAIACFFMCGAISLVLILSPYFGNGLYIICCTLKIKVVYFDFNKKNEFNFFRLYDIDLTILA